MEAAAATQASAIQSPRTSLNEIETEFKRELKASAKEYHLTVRQLKEQSKNENAASQLDDNKKGSVSTGNFLNLPISNKFRFKLLVLRPIKIKFKWDRISSFV